jgi:hypothetical protein
LPRGFSRLHERGGVPLGQREHHLHVPVGVVVVPDR